MREKIEAIPLKLVSQSAIYKNVVVFQCYLYIEI